MGRNWTGTLSRTALMPHPQTPSSRTANPARPCASPSASAADRPVIGDHDRDAEVLIFVFAAAHLADGRVHLHKILRGDAPHRENDLRPQQADLPLQVI